jgi:ADP-heptose:LPS heptosyltransferase
MLSTKILITQRQSPGDILMLTSAVSNLKAARPHWEINVETSCMELWENNPNLSRSIGRHNADRVIQADYKHEINRSTQRGFHFSRAFTDNLAEQLDIDIPIIGHGPDVFFSDEEMAASCSILDHSGPYWILNAGGKHDYTAKWWNPRHYQSVVDHFKGKIKFFQVGKSEHYHPRLDGVENLVDKTTLRELMVLTKKSHGVITPVSFLMHLAGGMVSMDMGLMPTIVLSGGREGIGWVGYTGHHFLTKVGLYKCCSGGPCWKSKATASLCEQEVKENITIDETAQCDYTVDLGVKITSPVGIVDLKIPKCMDDTRPDEVISLIEKLYMERYSDE